MSAPGGPPAPAPAVPPQAPQGQPAMSPYEATKQAGVQAKAQYSKLMESGKKIAKVKEELGNLSALGDMVTQDDVVDSAGRLVGHGLGATPMATLLADMPPDGQGLQKWIGQHLQGLMQQEAQLTAAKKMARYHLGLTAVHTLAAQHGDQMRAQTREGANIPPPSAGPGNSLTGGPGAGS